jgi:hypothetical protein
MAPNDSTISYCMTDDSPICELGRGPAIVPAASLLVLVYPTLANSLLTCSYASFPVCHSYSSSLCLSPCPGATPAAAGMAKWHSCLN